MSCAHLTAIRRRVLSRPVRCALSDGVIDTSSTVLDYGCGLGDDVRMLRELGLSCEGFDPHWRPALPRGAGPLPDVVMLSYVLNVISDPVERGEVLRDAWGLCRRWLVVAVRTDVPRRGRPGWLRSGDGYVTRRRTFQLVVNHTLFGAYLRSQLGPVVVEASTRGGVFYARKR